MFGLAVHTLLPVWLFPTTPLFKILGSLLVVLSGAFARWAFWTMRGLGTTASPRKQSEVLATSGPFRLSRNPIYVAMTGLYLGLVLLANALWPLVLLAPLLLLILKKAVELPDYVELSGQLGRGISVREHEFGKCARKDCA